MDSTNFELWTSRDCDLSIWAEKTVFRSISDQDLHLVAADGWAARSADGHIMLNDHFHVLCSLSSEVISDLTIACIGMVVTVLCDQSNHTCNLAKVAADVHEGIAISHVRDELDLTSQIRTKVPFDATQFCVDTLIETEVYACHLQDHPKAQWTATLCHYAIDLVIPHNGMDPRTALPDLI